MSEKKYLPQVFIPMSEIQLINSSKVEIPLLIFHSSKTNKYLYTFDYRDDGLISVNIEMIFMEGNTYNSEELESRIDQKLLVSYFVEVRELAAAIIKKQSS